MMQMIRTRVFGLTVIADLYKGLHIRNEKNTSIVDIFPKVVE
jgi:hypothetical protein